MTERDAKENLNEIILIIFSIIGVSIISFIYALIYGILRVI